MGVALGARSLMDSILNHSENVKAGSEPGSEPVQDCTVEG